MSKCYKMDFPHNEQNGILKYFYRRNHEYYDDMSIFSYNASGFFKKDNHMPQHLFDFDSYTYWTDAGNPNSEMENFVSFCFNKGFASIKGYEIKASRFSTLPNAWTLSGSNDNKQWFFNSTTVHAMGKNDVYYVDWNYGPFRCYRFDFINNTYDNKRPSDVDQIELFGTFTSNSNFLCKTIMKKYVVFDSFIFLVTFLMLK